MDDIPLKESKAYSYVLSVLTKYTHEADIQSGGLLALAYLLELDSYAATSIALQGDYDFIVTSIKQHSSNPGVVARGFQCLRIIVKYVCCNVH